MLQAQCIEIFRDSSNLNIVLNKKQYELFLYWFLIRWFNYIISNWIDVIVSDITYLHKLPSHQNVSNDLKILVTTVVQETLTDWT